MKILVGQAFSMISLIFLAVIPAAKSADTNPPPRLTVELRDGSRVVGTSVDKALKFHSPLLGKITLDVKSIRTLEFISTNSAKLTTSYGDNLTISLVDPAFAVKTGFGKVELAATSVRELTVSPRTATGTYLPGLVALWSGENKGQDEIGTNNGTLFGYTDFETGKIGQPFSFNGSSSYIFVPASPSLDVGLKGGFSLTAWINPAASTPQRPIVEWNTGNKSYGWGTHFWISAGRDGELAAGSLFGNILDTNGGNHYIWSSPDIIVSNQLQHVALTYDKDSGMAAIYLNGMMVAQKNVGVFTPQTSYDFYIGGRPGSNFWCGLIDEIGVYNRALSPDEIREAYNTGSNN